MPDLSPRLRSFIAIPLATEQQRQLAELQRQLKRATPELKTVRAENLHLTLHFLGDQPQQLLAEIGRNMLSIGEKKKNFNVSLGGLGFFPNRRRPRILWLGLQPQSELQELYRQLAEMLRKIDLQVEQRSFRPHLTLGRFRRPPQSVESLCPFLTQSCGSLNIDRIVLYTSELSPKGAVHRPMTTASLKGNGGE